MLVVQLLFTSPLGRAFWLAASCCAVLAGIGGLSGTLCAATGARPVAPSPALLLFLFGRWEWEDLEPYVQDLRGPGQTAEALLLKYTRASQAKPTDPVTYSMR